MYYSRVLKDSLILMLYTTAVVLSGVGQVLLTRDKGFIVASSSLLFLTIIAITIFGLLRFRKSWILSQFLLVPEWSSVADVLAIVLTFLVTMIPAANGRLRLFPNSKSDLLCSVVILFGGFASRRSLLLIKVRFLFDKPMSSGMRRPNAEFLSDLAALISRISASGLVAMLIWYSGIPAWLAALSFLGGWFIHSVALSTGKDTDVLGRINLRLAQGGYQGESTSPHFSLEFIRSKDQILNGRSPFSKSSHAGLPDREMALIRVMYSTAQRNYVDVIEFLCKPENDAIRRHSGRLTYFLEMALYHRGRYDEVIQCGNDYLDNVSRDNPFIYLYMGLAFAARGDLEQGLRIEESAECLSRDFNRKTLVCPLSLTFQALIRARLVEYGDYTNSLLVDAEGNIKNALRIIYEQKRGNNFKFGEDQALENMAEDVLGYIWYKQGLSEMAIETFERVIRRAQGYPWPYFHLALQYWRLGESLGRESHIETARSILGRIVREDAYSRPLTNVAQQILRKIEGQKKEKVKAA